MTKNRRPIFTLICASFLLSSCAVEIDGGFDDGTGGNTRCEERIPVTFEQRELQPEILLVVDTSGSMEDGLEGHGKKWDLMTDSISQLVEGHSNVEFGLSLYPNGSSGSGCASGVVNVTPNNTADSAILRTLDNQQPGGRTPTAATLTAVLDYYQTNEDGLDGRFVLLATDGNETCGGRPAEVAAELLDKGIKTFVLGFGNAVGVEELNPIAEAGGTEEYYAATSPEELNRAFSAILGLVTEPSCTLKLNGEPVSVDDISIEIDGEKIKKGKDGWTYEPSSNTVELDGQACRELRSDAAASVSVDLGCADPEVD